MSQELNTDERVTQLEREIADLSKNAGLVGCHLERFQQLWIAELRRNEIHEAESEAQRDRIFWLELRIDRLQRALDVVISRFNGFFRYEVDARAAWVAFTIALGEPDRPFPPDVQKPPPSKSLGGVDL